MIVVLRPAVVPLLLLCVLFLDNRQAFAQNKPIRLRNETLLIPPAPALRRPALQAGEEAVSGLYLVQFEGRYQPAWQPDLEAQGVRLLVYVPEDAFIARLTDVQLSQLRALPFIRWVGEYRVQHKLQSSVSGWWRDLRAGPTRRLNLMVSPSASPLERAMLQRLFQRVERQHQGRFASLMQGSLHRSQVLALVSSPAVLWVEPAPNPRLVDEVAAKIVAGDAGPGRLYTESLGWDASGVTVAVADSGLDTGNTNTMHPDIAGRVTALFHYGGLEDASDGHSHGTHVTGIVAGSGATGEKDEGGFLYGLGVAPGASIVAQRIFDSDGAYEAPPSFEALTRDAVRAGADIGSNSWGDDTQGRYDISAAEFDALVRDADGLSAGDQQYILEFSAGNAGPGAQTIGSPAVAKNVIASGASQNDRLDLFIYADGIDAMADFSSRGPAEDGRIKPDVVAPGTWIASMKSQLAPEDNAWGVISDQYIYQGGTSQAGPQVSGAAAVFVQYYRQTHGRTPSPALVKAALINSAVDMDALFGTAAIPNQDEGWGRVDLTRLVGDEFRLYDLLDQTNLLRTGQIFERRIVVLNGDEELKVTLAYTDVPGFPGALPALVNDLDLEVVDPDGQTYRGNQFNNGESVPSQPTGDRINNVEAVHVLLPTPGEYVVRVRGINVVQDSRRDTAAVDQDFALVVSGSIPAPGLTAILTDRPSYSAPSQMRLTVLDPSSSGKPSVSLTLRSTSEPAGELLVLHASTSSILFTGTLATATGPAVSDGRLQIAHGNSITATYSTAQNPVVKEVRADLVAPQISQVGSTVEFGGVRVSWTTDEEASSIVVFGQGPPGVAVTNRSFTTRHGVDLLGLVAGQTYAYYVVSIDPAGNARTNTNGGSPYLFTAPRGKTVLLVDAYERDILLDTIPIPLSSYTNALAAARISFDVWDRSARPEIQYAQLAPYRTVIWRINDMDFGAAISATEISTLTNFVARGGGFFMASMEGLSRFSSPMFNTHLAHIRGFVEDVGANPVRGADGGPVASGVELNLDYSNYPDFSEFGFGGPDFSDHIVPGTNAAAVFFDQASGQTVGVRFPRNLTLDQGRTVFLAFPLDAVPTVGTRGSTRSDLIKSVITYLAPGADSLGSVAMDNSRYTLPSRVELEVGDSDLAGAASVTVRAVSDTDPVGIALTLSASGGQGVFKGAFVLDGSPGASLPGILKAANGDTVRVRYQDASTGSAVESTALVDTVPPTVLASPEVEPDYTEATVSWSTSKPTDGLVEFGETTRLGRTTHSVVLESDHALTLSGLAADRLYYFKITSRDQAGNPVEDDNQGRFYTFHTLTPIRAPWFDDMNKGATNWIVFTAEESFGEWKLGVPANGQETVAHSPPHAWGSNLDGRSQDQVESFLISPAMVLDGGNEATLRFWHSYDFLSSEFDLLNGGELLIITNNAVQYDVLLTLIEEQSRWNEEEIDLTPYLGRVVYFVFHYIVFSFDTVPRPAWLMDDFSVEVRNVAQSVLEVTNSIQQARFAITGPRGRTGQGVHYLDPNAPAGDYTITFGAVPYYQTPAPQSRTLALGGRVLFEGRYAFPDANSNGISDLWEQHHFGNFENRPADGDDDHDGATELAEFLSGTDPRDPESRLRMLIPVPQSNGAVRLSWTSLVDRGYRVMKSRDLESWEPDGDWMNGVNGVLARVIPVAEVEAWTFWRVEVRP